MKQAQVAGSLINQANDREVMGFPRGYASTYGENPVATYRALQSLSIEKILEIAESLDSMLVSRFCAGRMLALLGDPRIELLNPKMIDIPGGTVRIGLDAKDVDQITARYGDTGILRAWIEKETPSFSITLKPYRIAKYPVTNREYLEFLKKNRYEELPTHWPFGRFPHEEANCPVYSLSPNGCHAYAQWLSKTTGREFRLLSEAEWEYAAAGPEAREFPWGEHFAPDRANTAELGLLCAAPVGIFPKGDSPFGVSDMAGNVEEIVQDSYQPYPGGLPIFDDLWRANPHYRIARGGSFARFRDLARCRRRHGWYPRNIYVMGFRLAEDL